MQRLALLAVGLLALTLVPDVSGGDARPRAFALADYFVARGGGFEGSKLIPVASISGRRLSGRGIPLGDAVEGAPVFSPGRDLVALGGSNFGEILLVDLVHMRRLAPIKLISACCNGEVFHSVDVLAWPSRHRLIATTGGTPGRFLGPRALRIVDPSSGRITRTARIGVPLETVVGPSGQVIILVEPQQGIGATRLVTVDRSGAIHTRRLGRIRSGTTYRAGTHLHREAALAVDFAAGHAFVLATGEPVADVDLSNLHVRYQPLAAPALDKGTAPPGPPQPTGTINPERGSFRVARWIAPGRVALSGYDSDVIGAGQVNTPAGLRIIDTRRWTVRVIDPGASSFVLARGVLLASTVAWDPGLGRFAGFGLAGFGLDGRPRYQLLPYRSTGPPIAPAWLVKDGHLYVLNRERSDEHRDLRTGRVLLRFRAPRYIFTMFSWRPPN